MTGRSPGPAAPNREYKHKVRPPTAACASTMASVFSLPAASSALAPRCNLESRGEVRVGWGLVHWGGGVEERRGAQRSQGRAGRGSRRTRTVGRRGEARLGETSGKGSSVQQRRCRQATITDHYHLVATFALRLGYLSPSITFDVQVSLLFAHLLHLASHQSHPRHLHLLAACLPSQVASFTSSSPTFISAYGPFLLAGRSRIPQARYIVGSSNQSCQLDSKTSFRLSGPRCSAQQHRQERAIGFGLPPPDRLSSLRADQEQLAYSISTRPPQTKAPSSSPSLSLIYALGAPR